MPPQANPPRSQEEWRNTAKGMMKAELKRQNLTYEDLAVRLSAMGIDENEASIRNKVSRGTFSAVFLLQTMHAIGVELLPFKQSYSFQGRLPPELTP